MTDTQPQPTPQMQIVPLPTNYSIDNVVLDGQQMVLVRFTTPAGQNVYWFAGDAAIRFGAALADHGQKAASDLVVAKTGLIVPGQ
jgi:hypothetical protein